jgi:hypothetical protein
MRGPGEEYSDVILRLVGTEVGRAGRPIFYSLPRRRCYARYGVDRLREPTRGAALPLPRPSVQHGSVAMPVPSATGDQASALAP